MARRSTISTPRDEPSARRDTLARRDEYPSVDKDWMPHTHYNIHDKDIGRDVHHRHNINGSPIDNQHAEREIMPRYMYNALIYNTEIIHCAICNATYMFLYDAEIYKTPRCFILHLRIQDCTHQSL